MKLISKLKLKLGEAKPASPQKAIEEISTLSKAEQIKILDYIKSVQTITNEPVKQ